MAMRVSTGILATAGLLFVLGAMGTLGTWALAVATVLTMAGTLGAVTVLEGRDFARANRAPADLHRGNLSVAGLLPPSDEFDAA